MIVYIVIDRHCGDCYRIVTAFDTQEGAEEYVGDFAGSVAFTELDFIETEVAR